MPTRVSKLSAQHDGTDRDLAIEPLEDGRFRVVLDGVERIVDARRLDGGGGWSLLLDGRAFSADVEAGKDGELVVDLRSGQARVKLVDPRRQRLAQATQRGRVASGPEAVKAPIPGKVVKVLVGAGERVAPGQGLVVVEAMKMENELRAAREATVKQVHVREGQAVEAQEKLVTLE